MLRNPTTWLNYEKNLSAPSNRNGRQLIQWLEQGLRSPTVLITSVHGPLPAFRLRRAYSMYQQGAEWQLYSRDFFELVIPENKQIPLEDSDTEHMAAGKPPSVWGALCASTSQT